MILDTLFDMLSQFWSSVSNWFTSISSALGFPVLEVLVAFTIINIVLAYTVRPAVGRSDDSTKYIEDNRTTANLHVHNYYSSGKSFHEHK